MTATPCGKCGLWIGNFFEGNKNYANHKCDPERVKLLAKVMEEVKQADAEYWEKRRKIESQLSES